MSKNYSIDSLSVIADGDKDFMKIVAQTFLDEIPPDLKAMEEAIHNNNKELTYQFAHKMKPNFEMFGIEVSKDITAIESWTKTLKSISAIQSNLDNVVAIVSSVFDELKEDFSI